MEAICRFGGRLRKSQLRRLCFFNERVPSQGGLHYILKSIDPNELENVLLTFITDGNPPEKGLHVALDGKTARGSRKKTEKSGTHLLSFYCDKLQGTLGQMRMESGENEITASLRFLREQNLKGLVITGDAIFTQVEICEEIVRNGGDYLFVVKDNQKSLKEEMEAFFLEDFSPLGGIELPA